jgi:hypothetical protein
MVPVSGFLCIPHGSHVDIVHKQEFHICKYEMASSGMNVAFMASFKSLTLTLTHAPTEEKEAEEEFYSSLDKVCDAVPNYDMKTTHKGTSTIKVEKDSCLYPVCGGPSLHNESYDNGERMVNFALGRYLAVTEYGINVRTFTRSPGDHLTTKYVTR